MATLFLIVFIAGLLVWATCNAFSYEKEQKRNREYQKNHPPIVRY